jgi:hypothetical protein
VFLLPPGLPLAERRARWDAPLTRPGTPGLDVFKIAGQSISGYLPSWKGAQVRTFQRGDASPAFAEAHRLSVPLGTPYRISYVYEGKTHDYLPDFVGTLCDGGGF